MCPHYILLQESKKSDAIVTLLTDDINKQFLDDNPEVAHELELKIKEKFKSMEVSRSKTADVADDDDVFDGAEA